MLLELSGKSSVRLCWADGGQICTLWAAVAVCRGRTAGTHRVVRGALQTQRPQRCMQYVEVQLASRVKRGGEFVLTLSQQLGLGELRQISMQSS